MFIKISRIVFAFLFLTMLILPLVTTNFQENKISEAEKRKLAAFPQFTNSDGSRNEKYTSDFETWINDNIGFRNTMIVHNAKIQFYLFNVLSNNSDMVLGPNGEFNYATPAIIVDYQHKNLYSEERLKTIADSFQCLKDYVEGTGAKFYYYQCWDKHSIYPEFFPKSIIQFGDKSKTDYFIEAIIQHTNVNVISPKEELLKAKSICSPYSRWGDSTHWSQRGAYIGYLKLMNTINRDSELQYRILQEEDYDITVRDQGSTIFGGIHKEDELENFDIIEPRAVLTKEKLKLYAEDKRHRFFTNKTVNNKTRLLIVGDSYFNNYILDDLAESFYEVIIIWGDYVGNIKGIIDEYKPDILVLEAAERVDRTGGIIKGVKVIRENKDIKGQ